MRTDRRSPEAAAYRKLYNTTRWRTERLDGLRREPLCRMCMARGIITPATVRDHIKPHKGDEALFWDRDNHQSLCKPCHDGDAQALERTGKVKPTYGLDGWPVTPSDALQDIVAAKTKR